MADFYQVYVVSSSVAYVIGTFLPEGMDIEIFSEAV